MDSNGYPGIMNNTKWEEIRLAMYSYPKTIFWRVKNIDSGYVSNWDGEWFYHFRIGGYESIEWLEIKVDTEEIKNDVLDILRKIHVAGEVLKDSIKICGYNKDGAIDYF